MCIFPNNSYKQHHNGFPAKASNLLKIFSLSLKSKYLSMNIRKKSPRVIVHKQVKMLSHVVNITVLPDVNYDNSYCTEIQKPALLMSAINPFKSTHLHITVCGILIERLEMIHSYSFTSGLNKKNTSL